MCGRFTLLRLRDFVDALPWIIGPAEPVRPRYNIAPGQMVAVVRNTDRPAIAFHQWGLIPPWAGERSIGNRLINARAETLATKPAFKNALQRRRCLIPADGFYEWRQNPDGTRTPFYIRMKSWRPFAFAGLWETWQDADGSLVPSCTIITTQPNELLAQIHDRMPVILPEDAYAPWLRAEEVKPAEVLDLLRPYPPDPLVATPVSRAVNDPRNDSPQCIAPADAPRHGKPGLF